jgi:vitamin B12 transporter
MVHVPTGFNAPKLARRLCLLALLPSCALAQSTLDPIVVIGTREPQRLARSSADIVRIDAATIRDSGADSVEDLLRREAGLQVVRNGGPGQSSGYFLRGAGTSGTVVLIDGVRVGTATAGQVEFESLSLAQIDHIEVLRGPASSLYGADAVGGVIQIFTRRGEGAPRLVGSAAVGGYGSRQGDVGISGGHGAFDYAAAIGHDQSRGVSAIRPNDQFGDFNPDNDGFSRTFGNARLGYAPAPGHRIGIDVIGSRLNAQYDSAEFNPPDFIPDPSPDFRNHLNTSVVSISYRGQISPLWTTTLQASKNIDDSTSGGVTTSRFRTEREQATWQNALQLAADQQLVLAYEHLHEEVGGDVFTDQPKRSNNAVLAVYSGGFGPAALEASLRRDDNSVYGSNTTGNLGASYEVLTGFRLRARAGTTYRAPTFNDLFFPGFSNPNLKPERGESFEVGATWQAATTSAAATLYRNRVTDLIVSDSSCSCGTNVGRARLQGATLSAAQRWGGFNVRATIDLLDATNADTGARLNRRAAHQESLVGDYETGAWSVGASVVDVGARPDGPEGTTFVLGGYGIVDLRAAWRFLSQWRLEAKLLNALDHRVEPVRDYQGLGRQAWLGIRYDAVGF